MFATWQQEQNVTLLQQKNDLFLQLSSEQDNAGESEERIEALVNQKAEMEEQLKDMEDRLAEEESGGEQLEAAKRKLEDEGKALKENIQDLELNIQKVSILLDIGNGSVCLFKIQDGWYTQN